MATLANLRCVPAGLRPEFGAVTSLEIEDTPLGGGGFGQNYVCRTLNGAVPPLALVVKILIDNGQGSARHGSETIQKMMERLRDLNARCQARGEPPLCDVPALLAVPQFSFEATLHGQNVCGYGALRLDTQGHVPFDTFTDGDEALRQDYLSFPLAHRLQIAGDLAQGFRLLDEIGFVHGDINPENLFINPAEGHLALIDFDSGAVVENPGDQPATWGKPGDWLAPEINAQRAAASPHPNKQVVVDRLSDAWSFGIGVHYLLFLHHPLVYLKDLGARTLQDYFAANLWPEIAPHDPLYNAANDAVYQVYRQEIRSLPTPLVNAFDVLLNTGTFAPGLRPDGVAWARALGAALNPPVIHAFVADRRVIPVGGSVTLFWQVDHAQRLHLGGVGDVTGQNSAVVTPRHDTVFTLTATGTFGQVSATSPLVRVFAGPTLPALPHITVPSLLRQTLGALPILSLPRIAAPDLRHLRCVGRPSRSFLNCPSQKRPQSAIPLFGNAPTRPAAPRFPRLPRLGVGWPFR